MNKNLSIPAWKRDTRHQSDDFPTKQARLDHLWSKTGTHTAPDIEVSQTFACKPEEPRHAYSLAAFLARWPDAIDAYIPDNADDKQTSFAIDNRSHMVKNAIDEALTTFDPLLVL